MSRIRAFFTGMSSGRVITVLAAAIVAVAVATPLATGASSSSSSNSAVQGGKRNPTGGTTKSFRSETGIIAINSTFGTRQSNKGTGGGAIYGCRAPNAGKGCIEASNLVGGQAFNFRFRGAVGGTMMTSLANKDQAKPFTTNATGVATGLNADRVDGLHANEIVAQATSHTKAAVVEANGQLGNPRGVKGVSPKVGGADGHYQVAFDADVSKCVPQATAYGAGASASVLPTSAADRIDVLTRTQASDTEAPKPADAKFAITMTC